MKKGVVEITYTGKGSLRYTIQNPSICSCQIDDNPKNIVKTLNIAGINSGSTNITISNDYDTQKVTIHVTVDLYAKNIELNTNNKILSVGDSFSLTAKVLPSYVKDKTVSWKSSNTNVATVTPLGTVRAKSEGTAIITVTSQDQKCSAQCTITVKNTYPERITLSDSNKTLRVGDSYRLSYTVFPSDADISDLKWSSSNTSVATISSGGYIEGISEGQTTISLSSAKGNCKAQCTITVKGYSDAIIRTQDLPVILKNETKSCTISSFGFSKITFGITRCIISVKGVKTADISGNSSCSIGYRLYKNGSIFKSGYLTTPELSVGESFSISTPVFLLEPALYQFELTDIK